MGMAPLHRASRFPPSNGGDIDERRRQRRRESERGEDNEARKRAFAADAKADTSSSRSTAGSCDHRPAVLAVHPLLLSALALLFTLLLSHRIPRRVRASKAPSVNHFDPLAGIVKRSGFIGALINAVETRASRREARWDNFAKSN